MFYLLAIVSMLGYSLQDSLLVRYARKMDSLSLAFYRNISFVVTLSPLLLFAPKNQIAASASYWQWWIFAGVTGGISMALRFASYQSIAVGVSSSISKASDIVFMTVLAWALFQERLSSPEILLIIVIITGAIWLGLLRNKMQNISNKPMLGISLAVLGTFFKAMTAMTFLWISRLTDPLASSYFWEAGIGIATIGVLFVRWICTRKKLKKVDAHTFLMIAACSAPTLIGTASLALAVRLGPIGIANAVSAASLITTSLLAWKWYKEKLRAQQWAAILLIALGVALLKFI